MRQRWETILKAEGLGVIDFASRSFVSSAAAEHESRTTTEKNHYRDAEALALIREILDECAVPVADRAVLYGYLRGRPLREIANSANISKDTAHRIVMCYVGNESFATVAEVSTIRPALRFDPRRAQPARDTANVRAHRRPVSSSSAVGAYFELGQVFAEQHDFKWARDREIWSMHTRGASRRRIALEIGMPAITAWKAIQRTRRSFVAWLMQRPRDNEQSDHAQIGAMFDQFTNHERY